MKVLVTTDGEAHSAFGTSVLAAIADRARTTIEVLSVNSFDISLHAAGEGPDAHYDANAGHTAAQKAVDEAVAALTEAGFSPTGRVVEGDAATEIIQVALEGDFDLVVVGAGSERWLDSILLGSTSTSIVHHAPTSVLVAHAPYAGEGAANVVMATDGSPVAIKAAEALAGLADPARCDVDVVAIDETGGRATEAATAAVNAAIEALQVGGIDAEGQVLMGHPAKVLLGLSKEHDLIVVGATGAGRFTEALLGSTTDKLARHAPATLIGR